MEGQNHPPGRWNRYHMGYEGSEQNVVKEILLSKKEFHAINKQKIPLDKYLWKSNTINNGRRIK